METPAQKTKRLLELAKALDSRSEPGFQRLKDLVLRMSYELGQRVRPGPDYKWDPNQIARIVVVRTARYEVNSFWIHIRWMPDDHNTLYGYRVYPEHDIEPI